jgi:hypothetical protein
MNPEELWQQLVDQAEQVAPQYQAVYLKAIAAAKATLSVATIQHLLELGNVDLIASTLVEAFGHELEGLKDVVRAQLQTVAGEALAEIPGALITRFEMLNPATINWLQQYELNLITQISQDTREGIRAFLLDGLKAGVNPRETARALRDVIGLTAQQAQAVANYRKGLEGDAQWMRSTIERALRDKRYDKTVQRMLRGEVTLMPEQVDKMVARYEARFLQHRAENIALSESLRALAAGRRLAWDQAVREGAVARNEIVRYWHTAHDERTCEVCVEIPRLNPDGRGLDEPFQTPTGSVMDAPAHMRCRCVTFIKLERS